MHALSQSILKLQSDWADSVGNFNFNNPIVLQGYFPMIKRADDDCFREGSLVQLSTGERKPVEDLKPATPDDLDGDALLSCDGTKTFVVGLIGGATMNNEPLLRISAESRCGPPTSIDVCLGHTFVKGYNNCIRASLLRKGDRIQSSYSESIVTSIEYLPFNPDVVVWDLYLASRSFLDEVTSSYKGRSEEYFNWLYHSARSSLLGLTAKQHLIFANDFQVGDLTIQAHLTELNRSGISLSQII